MSGSAKDDDLVLLRRDRDVVILTLNQPARRNALARRMVDRLAELLRDLSADSTTRCVVLTGAGGHFCSGGDVTEMARRTPLQSRVRFGEIAALVRSMAAGPMPLVAAVEGACIGAGLSLVCLCDHLVASRKARFSGGFMRMGMTPDLGGFWSVQQRVGRARAREIFALARPFDGIEAGRIGLVNEVTEAGETLPRAMEIAREYAAMPPAAMALLRAAFTQDVDSLDAALRAEMDYQSALLATDDHREAVDAFLAKRPPRFVGH